MARKTELQRQAEYTGKIVKYLVEKMGITNALQFTARNEGEIRKGWSFDSDPEWVADDMLRQGGKEPKGGGQ